MQKETVLRVADKDAQRKALKAVAKEQKRTDRKASQKVSWCTFHGRKVRSLLSSLGAFCLVLSMSEQTGAAPPPALKVVVAVENSRKIYLA